MNKIILEEWCKQWQNTMSLTPSIIGTESSGKFLQTSPSDAMMLIMSMEASFGDVSGPMRIAVPYYTLEPVVSRLLNAVSSTEKQAVKPPRWHEIYDEIPDALLTCVEDVLFDRKDDATERLLDLAETLKGQKNDLNF